MFKALRSSAWYQRHIVPNFTKSIAWLASVASFAIAYGPDAASFVLAHMDMLAEAVPTLSPGWKLAVLTLGHLIVFFGRPIRQDNMPQPTTPVAVVNVPAAVDVPIGGGESVAVPSEVRVMNDGTRSAIEPASDKIFADVAEIHRLGGDWSIERRTNHAGLTFDQFVDIGRELADQLVDGMPWSFTFLRRAVTHENDSTYLIADGGETLRFERGDTLWVTPGDRLGLQKGCAAPPDMPQPAPFRRDPSQ